MSGRPRRIIIQINGKDHHYPSIRAASLATGIGRNKLARALKREDSICVDKDRFVFVEEDDDARIYGV